MISVDWLTKVVFVPQSYLTMIGASLYELDVNQFRLDLKEIERDNMSFLDIHNYKETLYAKEVNIINGYKVEFENGIYTVNCTGANHNIADVKIVNSVSIIVNNTAGLIITSSDGSGGLTTGDLIAIDNKVDPTGKLKRRLVLQKGEDFDIEVE